MRTPLTSSVLFCTLVCACAKPKSSASPADAGASLGPTQGSSSLAFLNGFEGEIDAVVKQNKPGEAPLPFEFLVKSDRVRVEVPDAVAQGMSLGGKAYVLFDSAAKKASLVSDAQKQVLVVDLTKSGEQLGAFTGMGARPSRGGGAPQRPPTKLTKTGKFETVAGYTCEEWDVASDRREGTVCVADQGASWFTIPMTAMSGGSQWAAELLDGKHFPLRFVAYAGDGARETVRIEVTKIDKKAPAASLFEYPAGYRTTELSQMLQSLARQRSGMPMPTGPLRRGDVQ